MPTPRSQQVSLADTPWYACVSRCVRRSFLCGVDERTGESYEHRRQWVEHRILEVAQAFAIDVASYAIMCNHYHLVVRIDAERAKAWTTEEVIKRWHTLYNGFLLSQRYVTDPTRLDEAEKRIVEERAEIWRENLMNLSWFMGKINETIARRANAEDNCTGHFWEGRFKSKALLDSVAMLAVCAYTDLNPVRAGMAETPETSAHTSIKRRITALAEGSIAPELLQFTGNESKQKDEGTPFSLKDYIELVDWSGRVVRDTKRRAIDSELPPILKRLTIDESTWITLATEFEQITGNWVGSDEAIQRAAINVGKTRSRSPPLPA